MHRKGPPGRGALSLPSSRADHGVGRRQQPPWTRACASPSGGARRGMRDINESAPSRGLPAPTPASGAICSGAIGLAASLCDALQRAASGACAAGLTSTRRTGATGRLTCSAWAESLSGERGANRRHGARAAIRGRRRRREVRWPALSSPAFRTLAPYRPLRKARRAASVGRVATVERPSMRRRPPPCSLIARSRRRRRAERLLRLQSRRGAGKLTPPDPAAPSVAVGGEPRGPAPSRAG